LAEKKLCITALFAPRGWHSSGTALAHATNCCRFLQHLPCRTFDYFLFMWTTTAHRDACDEPGVMAALLYAGSFTGGAFVINEHNVRVEVLGDLLFVNARNYLHSAGAIRSIVLFMNRSLFTKYSKYEYVQYDLKVFFQHTTANFTTSSQVNVMHLLQLAHHLPSLHHHHP